MSETKDGYTPPQESKESEKTNLSLTLRQTQDLSIMLNMKLRERGLAKDYATRLNDIFKQLAGRDHDVYKKDYKDVE